MPTLTEEQKKRYGLDDDGWEYVLIVDGLISNGTPYKTVFVFRTSGDFKEVWSAVGMDWMPVHADMQTVTTQAEYFTRVSMKITKEVADRVISYWGNDIREK